MMSAVTTGLLPRFARRSVVALVSSLAIVAGLMTFSARPAAAASNWGVAITTQPVATAPIGKVLSGQATITNNAGGDTLTAFSFAFAPSSVGFDTLVVTGAPASLTATNTAVVSFTARLIGNPGTATSKVALAVTATPGALAPEVKTATTTTVTVTDALTAPVLTAATGPPGFAGSATNVALTDDIKYLLSTTNVSDEPVSFAPGANTPAGTTFLSATSAQVIAAGASAAVPLVVSVNDNNLDNSTIVETPTPTYTVLTRTFPIASAPASVTSTVQIPALTVVHTLTDANGASLVPGDVVNVAVAVTNGGHAPATAVSVANALTNLSTATAFSIDNVPCGGCSLGSSALGTLAVGATKTLRFTALVTTPPTTNSATNVATISYVGGSTLGATASPIVDSKSLVIATADAVLTMTPGPTPVPLVAGSATVSYNVQVANGGPATLGTTLVAITFPAGLAPQSASAALGCGTVVAATPSPLVCSIPPIANGGLPVTGIVTFTTTSQGPKLVSAAVTTTTPGQLASQTGNDTASATVTVSAPAAALQLDGNAPETVTLNDPGDTLLPEYTATFHVTNPVGPQGGEGVTVAFALQSGVVANIAYGAITGCTPTPTPVAGAFVCTVGSVPVGSTATISFPVNIKASGTFVLRATLSATTTGAPFSTSPLDLSTVVNPQTADLGFDAGQAPAFVLQTTPAGTTAPGTIAVKVTNFGPQFPSIAPKVRVAIGGATGLAAGAAGDLSAAGCTTGVTVIECTVASIGNGSTQTFMVPVVASAAVNATPPFLITIVRGSTFETVADTAGAQTDVFTASTRLNRAPLPIADVAPVVLAPGSLVFRVTNNDTDAEQQTAALLPTATSSLGLTAITVTATDGTTPIAGATATYAAGQLTFTPSSAATGDVFVNYKVTDSNGGESALTHLVVPVRVMRAVYGADPVINPLVDAAAFTTLTAKPVTLDLTTLNTAAAATPSLTNLSNGIAGLTLTDPVGTPTVAQNTSGARAAVVVAAGVSPASTKVVTYSPVGGFTSDPIIDPPTPVNLPKVDSFTYSATAPGLTVTGTALVRVVNANPNVCAVFPAETATNTPADILLLPDSGKTAVTDANGDTIKVLPTLNQQLSPADADAQLALLNATYGSAACPLPTTTTSASASVAAARAASVPAATQLVVPVAHAAAATPVEVVDPTSTAVPKDVVGTVVLKADGKTVTFTPTQTYAGPANFTYTAVDSRGGSSVRTVKMTVLNAPPQVFGSQVTVLKNKSAILLNLTGLKDANLDPLILSAAGPAAHGTLQNTGTILTYFAAAGYVGPDEVQYTVIDGRGGSQTAKVAVLVVEDPKAAVRGTSTASGTLPKTGSNADSQGILAAAMFCLGLVALGLGQRRRRLSPAALHLRG